MGALFRLCMTFIILLLGTQAMAAERALAPVSKSAVPALMKTAQSEGTVRVIVQLRVPFATEGMLRAADAKVQRADIARAANSFQERFAAAVKRKPEAFRSYQSIPFAAIEVTPAELEQLSRDPQVVGITPNRTYTTQLAKSVPLIRADVAQKSGFSGLGQTVAILDTGIDKTHPFLKGRVVAEACFSSGGWCPGGTTSSTAPDSGMPCPLAKACAHGTHVAGIVAGSNATSTGVAPQAGLMAVQIFSPLGDFGAQTSDGEIIAGLDYVYSRRNDFKIAAVNMSLGSGGIDNDFCESWNSGVEAAMANLRSVGIATVVASGNGFSTTGISDPACLPSAIAVGAVSSADWGNCVGDPAQGPTAADKVACFSDTGSKLALLAPGALIQSSIPGGGYASLWGTSMAAPHVAGAWAVLKQKRPNASVTDILEALNAAGVMVSDYRTGQETPRIDVKAALDFLDTNKIKLSYRKTGWGQGTVSFSPAGTRGRCGGSCVVAYEAGAKVTLTAAPAKNSTFDGWSGVCSGTGSCTVSLTQARSITAQFSIRQVPVAYTRAGTGSGSVAFYNDDYRQAYCSGNCVEQFDSGSVISLIPEADAGSIFGGWSGACSGQNICVLRMDAARNVMATFRRESGSEQTLAYESTGTGNGQVTFQPVGTSYLCYGTCATRYSRGTKVTVTAAPDEFSVFKGWSGACQTSKPACEVTMSAAQKISARFQDGARIKFTRAGSGAGSVTFFFDEDVTQAHLEECTSDCEVTGYPGAIVTVTAKPANGSAFKGWGGACEGVEKEVCELSLQDDLDVTASFAAIPPAKVSLTYKRSGNGSGSVTFSPAGSLASCSDNCSNAYAPGTRVTLTAHAVASSSTFAGWTGACSGTGACTITLSKDTEVGAIFNRQAGLTLNYVKAGTGQGSVSFLPDGSKTGACTGNCSKSYAAPAEVTLMATPRTGSVFTGWSGACTGKSACKVKVNGSRVIMATFATQTSSR